MELNFREILNVIEEKYQIIELINLYYADDHLDELKSTIKKYENRVFQPNERIIIIHGETDYYANTTSYGNAVYNLIKILNYYNIPQEFILFLTSFYGIKKEINDLCLQMFGSSNINVIYTSLLYDFPLPVEYADTSPVTIGNINTLYCCVNNVGRIHRLITLCYLDRYNLLDKGMISYNFKDQL
jgi:hypothetical protein